MHHHQHLLAMLDNHKNPSMRGKRLKDRTNERQK